MQAYLHIPVLFRQSHYTIVDERLLIARQRGASLAHVIRQTSAFSPVHRRKHDLDVIQGKFRSSVQEMQLSSQEGRTTTIPFHSGAKGRLKQFHTSKDKGQGK